MGTARFGTDAPNLSTVMETFWAALGGALVGGIASTFGALIVSKRTQTRTYRARIYDEHLPELTPAHRPHTAESGFSDLQSHQLDTYGWPRGRWAGYSQGRRAS